MRPLTGIRVLDFCWIGAGALVTKALAELGAEVIRIESHARPDNLRLTPPFPPDANGLEASGYYASRNPDKKSFALNMKHPRARDIALDLAAECSIITSNFRPGVMKRWGLSYEDVQAVNPEIIYVIMPMQGTDGPHSSFIGFGSTISALSGLVSLSGEPGRLPVGTGTHYPDHVPNPGHALVGVMAAIYHRERTGEGQRVELSQLESTLNVMGGAFLEQVGPDPSPPEGNRKEGVVPRGVYSTSDDKWIAVACATDADWALLSRIIDDRTAIPYPTVAERSASIDDVDHMVSRWTKGHTREEALAVLASAGVPVEPVNDPSDVLIDERLRARGFWEDIDHPVIGSMPMFHLPFLLGDDGRRPAMSRPPLLGEHTWEVASELLGMDRASYDELVAEGLLQ